MTMPCPLLTISQIANRLNVRRRQIEYAVAEYHIAPRMRAGIIRLWSEQDMPAIRQALQRIEQHRAKPVA